VAKANKTKDKKTQKVELDLNSPEFLEVFLSLRGAELEQVARGLEQLLGLDWQTVYISKGLNWEAVNHIVAPNGAKVYSIRFSKKERALAYREGNLMRFISLHPDHDSAYE
jgi:hypothetical protein